MESQGAAGLLHIPQKRLLQDVSPWAQFWRPGPGYYRERHALFPVTFTGKSKPFLRCPGLFWSLVPTWLHFPQLPPHQSHYFLDSLHLSVPPQPGWEALLSFLSELKTLSNKFNHSVTLLAQVFQSLSCAPDSLRQVTLHTNVIAFCTWLVPHLGCRLMENRTLLDSLTSSPKPVLHGAGAQQLKGSSPVWSWSTFMGLEWSTVSRTQSTLTLIRIC